MKRMRNAGAAARLFVVLLLAIGTLLGNLEGSIVSPRSSPAPPSTQAKVKHQRQHDDPAVKARPDAKRPGGKKHAGGKGKGHGKGNRKPPAELDSKRIATAATQDLACGDLDTIKVGDRTYCTHGDDTQMAGAHTRAEAALSSEAVSPVLCIDDGSSGPRVQLVYVHRNDRPDRYQELLPTFRRLAAEMDEIVDQSAQKTGGSRRLRFVTNKQCQVDVKDLGARSSDVEGWGSLIHVLSRAGYDQLDRKYLMLVDDDAFCGVGSFFKSDKPDTDVHDFTGYARVDKPCWDAGSMAHELGHTMGAVQYSAPHTSLGAHCIDEWDVMCYSDEPFHPKMKYLCPDGSQDFRYDCDNDDYFAANPAPGSYLDKHWNMANSIYLTADTGPGCVDAPLEPDDAYWYDYWDVPMRKFEVDQSEARAFCPQPGDTDWVLFLGKRGTTYDVSTSGLAAGVDTQLVVYRGFEEQGWDGMDQVATNDDRAAGDPSSRVTFTAPADATYLVGVSEAHEQAGDDQTYTLAIAKNVATAGVGQLELSRDSAKPEGAFDVTMRDLAPQAKVTVSLGHQAQASELGEMIAGANGVATATFTVPKGTAKGDYQIEAAASDGAVATAPFKVLDSGGKNGKSGKKASKQGKGNGKGKGKHGNGSHGKGKPKS